MNHQLLVQQWKRKVLAYEKIAGGGLMGNYIREESEQIMKLKVCHVNYVVLVNQPVVHERKRTLNVDLFILAPTARLFSLQFAIDVYAHSSTSQFKYSGNELQSLHRRNYGI